MLKKNNEWYLRALRGYSKKTLTAVSLTLMLFFVMAVVQIMKGQSFAWTNITPFEQPEIFERTIYSALTFITLGAFLYFIRLYQLLSWIFGSDRKSYCQAPLILDTLSIPKKAV